MSSCTQEPRVWAGRRWAPVLVAALTVLVFLPSLRNGFVNWDDDVNFLENTQYRGLSGSHLHWMFTTFLLGHYQPLAWVTLGMDYLLWGMDPAGYHLTSLLLHAAGAVLLYRILMALFPWFAPGAEEQRRPWIAAAATLFYSLHPLRVESVAWVTERRDVLCGIFFLLAILAYLRMQKERDGGGGWARWLAFSCACFAASLLSKALGIMLPFVLVALDAWPLQRLRPGRRVAVLLEKVPFVVVAAIDAAVMVRAMADIKAIRPVGGYDFVERAAQASYGLVFYIRKTLVPEGLSPLYLIETEMDPWTARYLVPAGLCLAGVAALVAARRPALWAAATCYALLLSPVLGFAVRGTQVAADRYSYLSCLPWSVAAAWLLARVPPGQGRRTAGLAAAGALVLLGSLATRQVGVWRDSLSLWDHAVRQDPGNHIAFLNRGAVYMEEGKDEQALADFERAMVLAPLEMRPVRNRGLIRHRRKDHAGALLDFEQALRREPGNPWTLAYLGDARRGQGDLQGALTDYALALRLHPRLGEAYKGRGQVRADLKDVDGAIEDFTTAIACGIKGPDAFEGRGVARLQRGDVAGALQDFDATVRLDPGTARNWQLRGDARRRLGDARGAVDDLTRALQSDPRLGKAFASRGLAFAQLGENARAMADLDRAIELGSELPEAHSNRGFLRVRAGDRPGAASDFEAALKSAPPDWPHRAAIRGELERLRP